MTDPTPSVCAGWGPGRALSDHDGPDAGWEVGVGSLVGAVDRNRNDASVLGEALVDRPQIRLVAPELCARLLIDGIVDEPAADADRGRARRLGLFEGLHDLSG